MRLEKNNAIELIRKQLDQIPAVKDAGRNSDQFFKWKEKTRTIIANLFGQDSPQLKEFSGLSYTLAAWTHLTPESAHDQVFVSGLSNGEAKLEAFILEIATFWPGSPTTTQNILPTPYDQLLRTLDLMPLSNRDDGKVSGAGQRSGIHHARPFVHGASDFALAGS